jgi:hypothetical protein
MFEDKVLDISLNFPDPHQNLVQSMVASYFNNFWNVLQGPETIEIRLECRCLQKYFHI